MYRLPGRKKFAGGVKKNGKYVKKKSRGSIWHAIPTGLQATGDRLQATGDRLQATGDRLQATGYRLQATGYRLQATGYTSLSRFFLCFGCNLLNKL